MQPEYYSSDPSINNEIVNSSTSYNGKGISTSNAFISWCAPTSAACQLGHLNHHYTAPLTYPSNISDGVDAGVEIPNATTASTINWDICGNGWGDYLLDGPSQRGIVGSTPTSPIVTDIGFYMNTNNVGINGVSASSQNGTLITNIYSGLDAFYQAFGRTNMVGMCYHKGTNPVTIGQIPAGIAPADSGSTLIAIKNEITNHRTVLGCFRYWNLVHVAIITVSTTNTSTETDIGYYNFGSSITPNPVTGETYNRTDSNDGIEAGLGHTVCIIGYIDQNTTGDINGNTDWLIVRDNQSQTHRNVAIPYDFSKLLATVYVNPGVPLNTTSVVNIVDSGGNKYVFNGDTTYDSNSKYTLTDGTYTLTGVSPDHPIAILNEGQSFISYNGSQPDPPLNETLSGTTYQFYSGDVTVTVSGNFGTVSVYCYYHGYMGGENLFQYFDHHNNGGGGSNAH